MSQFALEELVQAPPERFVEEDLRVEEDREPEQTITTPWNPNEIRVTPKTFSLRNVLDMIQGEDLDIAPEFQRHRVWKQWQKSQLIESIMLQIPLPSFYFSEEPEGRLQVVDGLQRLSAVEEFCQPRQGGSPLVLKGLEYLKDFEGKRFTDLTPLWHRRILNTQIYTNVIDPSTPDPVKFDIFKRLNTGGTVLNAQEIRHCISRPAVRAFLASAVGLESFQEATAGTLYNHIRMVDREAALRFFAFSPLAERDQDFALELAALVDRVTKAGTMDAFLTTVNRDLDRASTSERDRLLELFDHAMTNAYRLFGEHAFRKWPLDEERRNPINRALFETWSVILAGYAWDELAPQQEHILQAARKAMTDDYDYLTAISVSTGTPSRVATRFERAHQIMRSAFG